MPTQEEQIKKLQQDPTLATFGTVGRTPAGFVNVATGQTITTDNLASVSPPNVTKVPSVPIPSVSGITITEPEKPKDEISPLLKGIEQLQIDISGKEAEKGIKSFEATEGFRQQLLDVNKQLRAQQLQAMKDEEAALQRGETLGFATGEAARVARQNAFETFRLSSLSEALQGNITFAQSQAEKAVDIKYAQKEKELATARQNILDNYDSFTPEEKKRADATLLKIDKEDAFVKDRKENEKTAQTKTLEYAGIADSLTLGEMQKCKDALCVVGIANRRGIRTLAEQKAFKELETFGESADIKEFRQFFPNVDIKTATGRQQFLEFQAQKAAAEREPKGGVDELTETEKKDLRGFIRANENLSGLATRYRDLINQYGFTSPIFGNKAVIGEIRALRGQITAAYKEAKKLGTLDIGVLNLMEQIIGEEPIGVFKNFFGGKSKAIVSQLDSFIAQTQSELNQSKSVLGETAGLMNIFTNEELEDLDTILKTQTTTPSTSFNPAQFF